MSEFHVEVVRIGAVRKHPNADTLSITDVHGGYPVIFKTGDFKEGDLAIYVPVDAMVPSNLEAFAFLGTDKPMHRIKARKLRGIFSMGLLVHTIPGLPPGTDVREALHIEKYVPPAEREKVEPYCVKNPTRLPKHHETAAYENFAAKVGIGHTLFQVLVAAWCHTLYAPMLAIVFGTIAVLQLIFRNREKNRKPNIPHYDIEGLRRHKSVFKPGEQVWITEKIHGCNARFVHTGKKFFVGSRTLFRDGANVWTYAAEKYDLERKLAQWPNLALYGEVYGEVQDLKYGVPEDERVRFMAFDLYDTKTGRWFDANEFQAFCRCLDIPTVPTLYEGPWSDELAQLAEGKTTLPGADHVREGIVIKPLVEEHVWGLGRKFLKLAGEGYHLRKTA